MWRVDSDGEVRMDPLVWIMLSGALTFGVPLVLAARELWLLRDDGGGPSSRGRAPDAQPPVPPSPAGAGPLPECLVPKPLPRSAVRSRVLEDA